MKTIKINNPGTSIKISKEQALNLGIDISQDVIQGELKTVGPWNIAKSYKALATTSKFGKTDYGATTVESTEIFGKRTLSNVRQSGYCLEGYVSIKGKKYSAFTSSQLFEVDGKLINVAIIHARIGD